MAAPLHRLSLSIVQHEHSIVANGYAGSIALGESIDDDSGDDVSNDYRAAGSQSGEHSLNRGHIAPATEMVLWSRQCHRKTDAFGGRERIR